MAEFVFRKVQYGKEVVRGTAVAATARWTGKISVPVDRKRVFPKLSNGTRAESERGQVNQILADGISLTAEDAVFQNLPLLGSIGLKGGVVAVEQTVGEEDYLWDFTPSLTAKNNPDSVTIEYGDEQQAYEIEHCMAKRIKISGVVGDDAPVKVEADLFGKQITAAAFTAAIAQPVTSGMVANLVKFYVDDTWATLGITQKTGLLMEYDVEMMTGVRPKFHAEGVRTLTGWGEGALEAIWTLTMEGTAEAKALWDAWRAGTKKALRLEIIGEQIGAGDPHSCVLDIFGELEAVVPLGGEKNGDNLYTCIFRSLNDLQATPHAFGMQVTTDRNTI